MKTFLNIVWNFVDVAMHTGGLVMYVALIGVCWDKGGPYLAISIFLITLVTALIYTFWLK